MPSIPGTGVLLLSLFDTRSSLYNYESCYQNLHLHVHLYRRHNLAALRRAVPKPHGRDRNKNEWISEETWRLIDERVSARRGTGVHSRIRRLGRAIQASLQGDRKRRVEAAGQEVKTLLGEDPPNPKEA